MKKTTPSGRSAWGRPDIALVLDVVMRPLKDLRAEIVPCARGDVLELGAGTGGNFPYYSPEVKTLTAIEPDPFMLRKARRRVDAAPCPVTLEESPAETLPYGDARFDTVVATFVLCSVADPRAALEEARRVLRPGGTLLFAEHVAHEARTLGRAAQTALDRPWSWLAGGCHLNRDTLALIRAAGFEDIKARYHGEPHRTLTPMVRGEARNPPAGSKRESTSGA